MQVGAVGSVGSGALMSATPGKIAGLGRAAMFANFITMVDDWIALNEQHAQRRKTTDAGALLADAAALSVAASLLPPSPFYTYKRGADGHFSIQKVAAADLAATMLLAIA